MRCSERYLAGNDAILEALALFDRERAEIVAGQAWAGAHAADDDAAAHLAADYPYVGIYVLVLRLDSRTRILWIEAALDACRRLGDRGREGAALGNMGRAWADLHEPRRAIAYYEQVFTIAREIGDRRSEGNALGNLGTAWAALGESRQAIDFYEQRLTIAREIGDRLGEGNALWNMALAYETLNEFEQALEKAKTDFVIYRAIEATAATKVAAWLRERGVDPDSL